jgi:hypothetical protein
VIFFYNKKILFSAGSPFPAKAGRSAQAAARVAGVSLACLLRRASAPCFYSYFENKNKIAFGKRIPCGSKKNSNLKQTTPPLA